MYSVKRDGHSLSCRSAESRKRPTGKSLLWTKGYFMQAQSDVKLGGTTRELFQVSGYSFPECNFIGGTWSKWKYVNLTAEAAYSRCRIKVCA